MVRNNNSPVVVSLTKVCDVISNETVLGNPSYFVRVFLLTDKETWATIISTLFYCLLRWKWWWWWLEREVTSRYSGRRSQVQEEEKLRRISQDKKRWRRSSSNLLRKQDQDQGEGNAVRKEGRKEETVEEITFYFSCRKNLHYYLENLQGVIELCEESEEKIMYEQSLWA